LTVTHATRRRGTAAKIAVAFLFIIITLKMILAFPAELPITIQDRRYVPFLLKGNQMSEETTTKVSTAFWVIAGLLAVWNLSGLYMYYQMSITTPEQLQAAGYSVVQIEHILGTPAWAHSAYAIAVNAGVLGVIFLLLRKAWAIPMFVLSLIGALLQDLDAYVLRGALEHFETVWLVIPITVIVICVFEIWYSRAAKAQGWLS
jgi:hypothetical protein